VEQAEYRVGAYGLTRMGHIGPMRPISPRHVSPIGPISPIRVSPHACHYAETHLGPGLPFTVPPAAPDSRRISRPPLTEAARVSGPLTTDR
jgi:hypothetical protein